jgi:hypothetical protein
MTRTDRIKLAEKIKKTSREKLSIKFLYERPDREFEMVYFDVRRKTISIIWDLALNEILRDVMRHVDDL